MKALQLLKNTTSLKERAEQFAPRIKKSIQTSVLDSLQIKIDELDDAMFEALQFSLGTDINAGQQIMTKEQCESRFAGYIDLKYEQSLLKAELKNKQETFNTLFGDESSTQN